MSRKATAFVFRFMGTVILIVGIAAMLGDWDLSQKDIKNMAIAGCVMSAHLIAFLLADDIEAARFFRSKNR